MHQQIPWSGFALVAFLSVSLVGNVVSARQSPVVSRRAVAITVDDLPLSGAGTLATAREVNEAMLQTLAAERAPATGFVNEVNVVGFELAARTTLLEAWLDAGMDLGNHTYSHVAIDAVPFEVYRADLIRGETITRQLLEARGRRLRYFRHPQLRTGPTQEYKKALDALLNERGYRVAPITIDNNDFVFADAYRRARRAGDLATMARVSEAYVPYLEQVVAHFEQLSRDLLGYEVPQTLIVHANELNAAYLDDVIQMLRRRGYSFITLDAALEDPAYAQPDDVVAARGLSWLHRWTLARGMPMRAEPLEPAFVRELFNRR